MTTIKEVRKQAAEMIQDALETRLEAIKKTPEYAALKAELLEFEDNGNDNLHLGEGGMLICSKRVYLDRSLCTDADGSGDVELASEVLSSCSDVLYFHQDDYSQGYFEWTAEQCLGEAVIYNENPERHCYAIHSNELGLKVDRVVSERHGFLLIERAMRKRGCFPSIVSADRYGSAFYLTMPNDIPKMSDVELIAAIDAEESAESA